MTFPWYRAAFGPSYLTVYRRRDEEDARKLRGLLGAIGCSCRNKRVLDVGCGHGRHLRVLEEAGADAYGIDLSPALLLEARGSCPDGRLALADMRALPFQEQVFDLALSLFTTFGYFETDQENARVLVEIRRVLRRGGQLLLDTMNAVRIRASMVAETRRMVGSIAVDERRWIDETVKRINKRVVVTDPAHPGGPPESWTESVRLWTADELRGVVRQAGLQVVALVGGFDGASFSPESSERMILVCKA